jgi:AcrR family transcriptional regulator
MALIADRVGITAGALYRHYATRAELLDRAETENNRVRAVRTLLRSTDVGR